MKKLIALSAMLASFTIQADPTVMIHKNNAERYVRVDLEENRSYDIVDGQREDKLIVTPRQNLQYKIVTVTDTEDFETAEVTQLIQVSKDYKHNYIGIQDSVSSIVMDTKKYQISGENWNFIVFNHFKELELKKINAVKIELSKHDRDDKNGKYEIVSKKTVFYSNDIELKNAKYRHGLGNFNKQYFDLGEYTFIPNLYFKEKSLVLGEIENKELGVEIRPLGGAIFEISLLNWKKEDAPVHFIADIHYLNTIYEANIKADGLKTIIDISKL
ncbi:MAG: hypothetical protein CL760_11420 [Chloroflexi bacterium]|nr:hypothetical protein [Chloroflexota bacterium]|tara:strand:+ start:13214 stop:14029 length:816 start_codon:yes stop_codon:yes gene_type:complete